MAEALNETGIMINCKKAMTHFQNTIPRAVLTNFLILSYIARLWLTGSFSSHHWLELVCNLFNTVGFISTFLAKF